MRCIPIVVIFFGLMVSVSTAADNAELPRVPEGFVIEKAAAPPLVKHPMMAGFDDRGRLFVAASSGKNLRADKLQEAPPNFIRMLEDTDDDGRFDKSTVFADDMTLPMGALWYRGALYVASPPSIWKLEDTDDDGVADERTEIVNTFGFSGNAASIHGCFLGPNGRLYWCDGRHGHEFRNEGGKIVSTGKAARIFSCRPDGSDVEVFCGGGMDNPVEVDFTPAGEMLGSVNILLSKPRVDCLVHWVEGGVYPRRDQEDCIAEFPRTGDLLPPMTRLGHIAVSGMLRYRSTHFGEEYRNNLFTTVFNTHKVVRSVVERSGATFRTREEDFLVSENPDFHPTDVIEDADGSLLVIDTGGWFRIGCPTSEVAKPQIRGAIYRIRRKDGPTFDDPRGSQLRLDEKRPDGLARYLDDPRPAVRERVIERFAEIPGDKTLKEVLLDREQSSVTARRNAVWALSRICLKYRPVPDPQTRSEQLEHNLYLLTRALNGPAIREALDDPSESVRLAAVRSLGMLRDGGSVEALSGLVVENSPAIRRQAATALGRIGDAQKSDCPPATRERAVEALFAGLSQSVTDRFLEHAFIYALIRIADRAHTVPYLENPNPQVRRAALIALDQMQGGQLTRELVTPLLDTDDPALQQTALEIVGKHPGWGKATLRLLRDWLEKPRLTPDEQPVLRGFLIAQSGDPQIRKLVGNGLTASETAEPIRLALLEVIQRAAGEELPAVWREALRDALRSGSAKSRLQAVRILQGKALDAGFQNQLAELAGSPDVPAELRVSALRALMPTLQALSPERFAFLSSALEADVPNLVKLDAARALTDAPLTDKQLRKLAGRLNVAGPLTAPVLLRAFDQSSSERAGIALVSALRDSPVAANLPADELARVLRSYPDSVQNQARPLLEQSSVDPQKQRAQLESLSPLLKGGDPKRGRDVFFSRQAACASCHAVEGEGGRVGPDLTQIGKIRSGQDLLEALVLPSASFAREFRSYTILTEQGRVHTGVITRRTAEHIVLRTADLAEIRISRESIERMKQAATSIMPKGLDETLGRRKLRDLLAFLQQLK